MDSTKTDLAVPYRILLALSDDADAKLVAAMLGTVKSVLTCKITHISRLEEAVAVQREHPQDVAIVDLHLPDAPGFSGLDFFRRETNGLPVIVYAFGPGECSPSRAAQRGAHDLLVRGVFDAYLLVRAVRNAAERRRSREALRRHLDKLTRFQSALLDLAKRGEPDPEESFRRLCESAAATLDVERVGIWLFNPDHTEIVCRTLHTRSTAQSGNPATVILARDYPRYFAALEESRVVAADDARRDPRTSEFTEGYLTPLGITSMMDAPIRLHGVLVGVICHEHTGPAREWPLEDQEFASSVADLAALSLEAAERRRAEESLVEERNFTDAVLDSTDLLMVVLDAGGRVVRFNRAAAHLSGYSASDAVGKLFWEIFIAPEDSETVREIVATPATEAKGNQHEHAWLTRHGAHPFIAWSNTPLVGRGGMLRFSVITGIDISQRKALEEQLIHDAFHDSLTGLPNRALFLDRLGMVIRQTIRRRVHKFGVLFVDMDRFKIINDSLGHLLGDQFLIEICRRLEKCVRPGDTVARFGGDEFTILVDDVKSVADCTLVASRIHQQLSTPVRVAGQDVFSTASIGIAMSETGYERAEDVLRDADIAMYRAKAKGGASHEVFDRSMHSRAVELLRMETELRRAIERDEFQVFYQPVVTIDDGRVTGFEALIRWNHPERGLVPPLEFIRMSEETGMIIEIDRFVLREACRQLKDWRARIPGMGELSVSVNLSVKQFARPDLADHVRTAIREFGLDPAALRLEITETVLLDSSPSATDQLEQLHKEGFRIYLDDFGTGYSSLSYLHRFPVHTLKIDRSFVMGMKADGGGREIIRTIVALAQNLNLHVIAEGVETAMQRDALRELRCEFAQGYMFSRPVDSKKAEAMLNGKALP
ncbi:MAG: EAL domain-containing protein [Planctomycetes bacterium]|nr:EAL domain-containing protein [Planctomycetota bacterium]